MDKVMPVESEVYLSRIDKRVKVSDLSVEYLYKIEEEPSFDTELNLVIDASNLSLEEIRKLRVGELRELSRRILELSFPNKKSDTNIPKKK